MWRRAPLRPLHGSVIELWAGLVSGTFSRHRVFPNGEVMLMLHIDSGQRLTEHDGAPAGRLLRQGIVAGIQEAPATYESFAPIRVVSARLTPLGAFRLLGGLPQAEIAGGVFDVAELLPRSSHAEQLRARMHEAADLGQALDLFEAWLLARQRAAPEPHAATLRASAALERRPGQSIGTLARECGLSPRRLHELFMHEVGVSAKRVARLMRFRRGLDQLIRTPQLDLCELALCLGYYDQAHLCRDFRELAGMSPLQYRAAARDGHDGADVIGG